MASIIGNCETRDDRNECKGIDGGVNKPNMNIQKIVKNPKIAVIPGDGIGKEEKRGTVKERKEW